MSKFPTSIGSGHSDHELLSKLEKAVYKACGGREKFLKDIPQLLQNAIDFVIDPVLTARTAISELDNVEKTFVGLKIEHCFRDYLNVPKGLHRDLRLAETEVDIKNTVSSTWMIPPETFRQEEPCLLFAIADSDKQCWIGLIVARDAYLGSAIGNRDSKRQVTAHGKTNILWLAEAVPLPKSRWVEIDMNRFRELRKIRGGAKRATIFFQENLDKVIHRNVVKALLYDQLDYMKRLRENGGARQKLKPLGIKLLSGAFGRQMAATLGFKDLKQDEFVAVMRK